MDLHDRLLEHQRQIRWQETGILDIDVSEQALHRGQHRLAESHQQGQRQDQANDPGHPSCKSKAAAGGTLVQGSHLELTIPV